MAAGAGHFKRPLHILLPLDFREIGVDFPLVEAEDLAGVDFHRLILRIVSEDSDYFAEVFHAVDVDIVDHGGLGDIRFGHYKAFEAHFAGFHGHRKNSLHGEHRAVERELAGDHVAVETGALHISGGDNQSDYHREVELRSLFLHVGGSEVDGGAEMREFVAVAVEGGDHALVALLYGGVGHADDIELRARHHGGLDCDGEGVDSLDSGCIDFCQHVMDSLG